MPLGGGVDGAIEGVVRDSSGNPVPGAVVAITEGPAHPDIAAVTSDAGRYRLTGLGAGRYTVVVHPEGRSSISHEVTVATGGTARLDIELRPS